MLKYLWLLFKALLSCLLIAVIIGLAISAPHGQPDPSLIGISAILLLFAALPWVNFQTPNRSLGLVCMLFASGVGYIAFRTATGAVSFPRPCQSRRALTCQLENQLHDLGGPLLASAPFAILALLAVLFSIRILLHARTRNR